MEIKKFKKFEKGETVKIRFLNPDDVSQRHVPHWRDMNEKRFLDSRDIETINKLQKEYK
jgi:hypothetical protein|tara:strand:- start:7003 stop:7179 length:177 start_codon:yes stop_codon:yes gene_type:complete